MCSAQCVCVRERGEGVAGTKRKTTKEGERESQTERGRGIIHKGHNASSLNVQTDNALPMYHEFTLLCIHYYTNDSQPETQSRHDERMYTGNS